MKWEPTTSSNFSIGDTIVLTFQSAIELKRYIYSADSPDTTLSIPAKIVLKSNQSLYPIEGIESIGSVEVYDSALDTKVRIMKDLAMFRQRAVVKQKPIDINVSLRYMLVKKDDDGGMVIHASSEINKTIN